MGVFWPNDHAPKKESKFFYPYNMIFKKQKSDLVRRQLHTPRVCGDLTVAEQVIKDVFRKVRGFLISKIYN